MQIKSLGSEKLQNESSPCSNFIPKFAPNFSRPFRAFFSGKRRPLQIYPNQTRRLELSISKNTLQGRWGQGPGSDPKFPAGLPFPAPEILEFVAFGDSGKIFQRFFGDFPEFSSRTPKLTPETATAFLRIHRKSRPFFNAKFSGKCEEKVHKNF